MAKIYISSTFKDLIKQRRAAAQAVEELGHEAVCMEKYVTSSVRPLDKCLDDVRGCDAFIGIFAWRYGSIPKGHKKSITHLEYEEARKKGIPCLIFLLDEHAPWPVRLVAKGAERQKIDALRAELQEDFLVSIFEDTDHLSKLVKKAITTLNPKIAPDPPPNVEELIPPQPTPPPSPPIKISPRRLAIILLAGIALFLFLNFALPAILVSDNNKVGIPLEASPQQKREIPRIDKVDDPKKGKQKGVDKKNGGAASDVPSKKVDIPKPKDTKKIQKEIPTTTSKQSTQEKRTKPPDSIENNVKKSDRRDEIPNAVKEVENRGIKTKKNSKGHWEADFGDGIVMIYIPAGEFTMGSNKGEYNETPVHSVYLDGYWIGKTEVTVGQYMKFVEETKSYYPEWKNSSSIFYRIMGEALAGKDYPIVGISWKGATAYCEWLSKRLNSSFFLPTEAQWEKAARGTDGREYPWGKSSPTGDRANFYGNTDGYKYMAPVGSFPNGASPYGALDMAGNVWEWCRDRSHRNYYKNSPKNNPQGPESDVYRVMRGGGWFRGSSYCRCAYRGEGNPFDRDRDFGFRLARPL